MSMAKKNLLIMVLVVGLAVVPIVLRGWADFSGADDRGMETIAEINPGYQPWFNSIWEPPSKEVENFLFALQAAVGSGIVCYYLGYIRGRKKEQEERSKHVQH